MPVPSEFTGATLPDSGQPAASWYVHLDTYDETLAPTVVRRFANAAARNTAFPAPALNTMVRLDSPNCVQIWDGDSWEQVWPAAAQVVAGSITVRGVGALAATAGTHKMLGAGGAIQTIAAPFGANAPYRFDVRCTAQYYGNTATSRVENSLQMREGGGGGFTELFKRSTGDRPANVGDNTVVLDTWFTATGAASLELDLLAIVSGGACNWYATQMAWLATRLK